LCQVQITYHIVIIDHSRAHNNLSMPIMSQKFEAQCPFGVAGERSHRDGPLSTGAPLGDHCVPMDDVQCVIFLCSCIVDFIHECNIYALIKVF
jgi:hypothetical protein